MPGIGDIVNITIQSVAFGGGGIAHINDMVIFVPFAVDGDRLEVAITQKRKKYLRGIITKIVRPSPFRIEPACRYYTRCGGCQYQHIHYSHQLQIKERQVREVFERIGKFKAPPVEKIIPSPRCLHYRGHADFHVEIQKNGKTPKIGFMQEFDHSLVDVERCEIADESINQQLGDIRRNLLGGRARGLTPREKIWSSTPEGKESPLMTGKRKQLMTRIVKGETLVVPRRGFFQANLHLTATLVDCVIERGHFTGRERILDGYCGSGLFAFFMAPHVRWIWGIEANEQALTCARMNVVSGGLDNVSLWQGDIAEALKHLVKDKVKIDMMVLDPPRGGCSSEVIESLSKMRPSRIIYVSCHCATQARDIRKFVDYGYTLNSLQPLDMFPQTGHIEVVASLEGK
jgi:tRNA/tmRNA/rRNA uracil-C5-methylase (TrmA/RlmC/RlmD family)